MARRSNIRLNTAPGDDTQLVVRLGRAGPQKTQAVGMMHTRGVGIGPLFTRHGNGQRAGTFGPTDRAQRVTVKVYVAKHRAGGKRLLARHAAYLMRDSAARDGQAVKGYTADRSGLDLKDEVKGWADDRHHFRFIVSAERGHDIPDLTRFTRRLMATVQRDAGTKLQWVAVDHFNTDNPHTHVLVRGRTEAGKDLVLSRDFIAHTLRQRASELATKVLGPRSRREIHLSQLRDATASRMTRLDWALDRYADTDRVVGVGQLSRERFIRTPRDVIEKRLEHLQSLWLATRLRGGHWRLSTGLVPALQEMGKADDVIKNLHSTKQVDRDKLTVYGPRQAPPQKVYGRVLEHGSHEEQLRDLGYLLVRDTQGHTHYVPTRQALERKHLGRGSLVSLERASWGGVRVRSVSDHALRGQVTAEAYTWLDRQLHRQQLGKESPFDTQKPVARALARRRAWLIERGYATEDRGQLRWKPGRVNQLIDQEVQAAIRSVQEKLNRPTRALLRSEQTQLSGRLEGSLSLHSGRYLAVHSGSEVVLAPLRGAKVTRQGDTVTVRVNPPTKQQDRGKKFRAKVTEQDLKEPKRLMALYQSAVKQKIMLDSDNDRLKFFAAAQYVSTAKCKSPPGLFMWMVNNQMWDRIRAGNEDKANQQIKQLLYGVKPQAQGKSRQPRRVDHQHLALSYDAKLVLSVQRELAHAGYKGDPFVALQRRDRGFTRQRWDNAITEITNARLLRARSKAAQLKESSSPAAAVVGRVLQAAGVDPRAIQHTQQQKETERGA